ncbi:hypothetical protein D3C86_1731040 [compost metagenome]
MAVCGRDPEPHFARLEVTNAERIVEIAVHGAVVLEEHVHGVQIDLLGLCQADHALAKEPCFVTEACFRAEPVIPACIDLRGARWILKLTSFEAGDEFAKGNIVGHFDLLCYSQLNTKQE